MDIVSEESQHLGKYRDKPESYIYTTCKNLRFTTEKKNLRTIEALDPFILTSSSQKCNIKNFQTYFTNLIFKHSWKPHANRKSQLHANKCNFEFWRSHVRRLVSILVHFHALTGFQTIMSMWTNIPTNIYFSLNILDEIIPVRLIRIVQIGLKIEFRFKFSLVLSPFPPLCFCI